MAVACVRKYSGVCSKLTGRDLDEVEKLCEVSCRFLRDNAEEFIHQRHILIRLFCERLNYPDYDNHEQNLKVDTKD